jgi:ABC-type ATPase with predicted acetyltransferase domain
MSTKCSNCGSDINPNADQCPSCGAQFEQAQSKLSSVPASWIGIITGFGVMLILAVLDVVSPIPLLGISAAVMLIVWIGTELIYK